MRDEVSTCPFVVCQHWFDTPGAFRIYKKCSRKNNQAMKKAAKAMIEAGLNLQLNVMTGRMATVWIDKMTHKYQGFKPLPRPTGFVMQAARMGRPTQPAPTKKTTTFRWAKERIVQSFFRYSFKTIIMLYLSSFFLLNCQSNNRATHQQRHPLPTLKDKRQHFCHQPRRQRQLHGPSRPRLPILLHMNYKLWRLINLLSLLNTQKSS